MTNWVPGAFYFVRSDKHSGGRPTVVQVSTVFGEDREYWTLVAIGSDQHYMISDFDQLSRIEFPSEHPLRLAAE